MLAECLTIAPASWLPIVVVSILIGVAIGAAVVNWMWRDEIEDIRWRDEQRARMMHPSRQGEAWERD